MKNNGTVINNGSNKRTVVAAVIFPANLPYFHDFCSSLSNQTFSSFDLFLVNDGCKVPELEKILEPYALSYHIVRAIKGTPAQIRGQLIGILKTSGFDIIIFGDTDDYFSLNRVEKCVQALQGNSWDVAFNDLCVVNQEGEVLVAHLWKDRKEAHEIDLEFLLKYNVLGLGNTALRRAVLDFELKVDPDIPVFDWIFYLQAFNNNENLRCKFLDEVTTSYRQHSVNTLGITSRYSREKLEYLFSIKESVLGFAKGLGIPGAQKQMEEVLAFRKMYLTDKKGLDKKIKSLDNQEHFFWFEETICDS